MVSATTQEKRLLGLCGIGRKPFGGKLMVSDQSSQETGSHKFQVKLRVEVKPGIRLELLARPNDKGLAI